MRTDGPPRDAPAVDCPYLPGRSFVQEYFFGTDLTGDDLDQVFAAGWRRFGLFYFHPHCPDCQACRPLRVDAAGLKPTASQRQVWRRNADVEFCPRPLAWNDEYFEIYAHHSRVRFGREADADEFREGFFTGSVPAWATEYRIGGRLAGLGLCDLGAEGVSSVYYVFHEDFAARSLGTYSVLRESAWAAELGRRWYYLGYWVEGNATMAYKGRFQPRQVRSATTGLWEDR